jgi:hypothetical protein
MATIAEKVSSHHKEIIEKNRRCLYQLVQIIYFLAKQGLPLRGHNQKLVNQKRGNFLEMIDFIRMFSTDINKKINYTSPCCQNEILTLIAAKTRQELLPKQGDFYALMADEKCDISTIEQMSICLRFVDDDLIINESFWYFTI